MMQENMVTKARTADLLDFLSHHNGLTFQSKSGKYRCTEHPSLAIKSDRLSWYWHSKGIGGYGALDFLIKIEGYSFKQAVERVGNGFIHSEIYDQPQQVQRINVFPTIPFVLPEKAYLYKRLFAYLCNTRGIDNHIITTLIQEKKLYEDTKGNVVFVGYDEYHEPRYAALRGTYANKPFRMECAGSDKRYGFNMTYNDMGKLYIFESAIDSMSHAALENLIAGDKVAWQKDNRLSLGGTSSLALDKYTELHPDVMELVFCLDNDTAGRAAAVAMARQYCDRGYRTRLELPTHKDYNEDLLAYKAEHSMIRKVEYER